MNTLQVTSKKDQEQYWARKDQPLHICHCQRIYWGISIIHCGTKDCRWVFHPIWQTRNHPAALATKQYGVGMLDLIKANLSREYLIMKRNSFIYIFKLCQVIIYSSCITMISFSSKFYVEYNVTFALVYLI